MASLERTSATPQLLEVFDSFMGMRQTIMITSAISVLALLLVASASTAHGRRQAPVKCPPGRGHVIVADAQAQAYVSRSPYGDLEARACAYQSRRSYQLENAVEGGEVPCALGCPPSPGTVALGGAMVAYTDNVVVYDDRGAGMSRQCEVHVVDHLGNRIVASGADIDPQSLALAGGRLYWTQGSKPSSTTLN